MRVAGQEAAREADNQRDQAQRRRRRPAPGHDVEPEEHAGEDHRRPEVLLQEEEEEHQAHADGHRQQHETVPVPQRRPPMREVPGEEQHDEHADRLDRLRAHQVHFRVARSGAAAERDQQQRQADGAGQRQVDQAADEPAFEVERGGHREHETPGRDALREAHEQHRVAHRVPEAHHHHEADATQGVEERQQVRVAGRAAQAQPGVRGVEGEQEDDRGPEQAPAELGRGAGDGRPAQRGELRRGEERDGDVGLAGARGQLVTPLDEPLPERREVSPDWQVALGHGDRAERADAGHRAAPPAGLLGSADPGGDPLGHEPALDGVGHDRLEQRQQRLGPVPPAEVDQPAGRERPVRLAEDLRARVPDEPEADQRDERRGDEPDELGAARAFRHGRNSPVVSPRR